MLVFLLLFNILFIYFFRFIWLGYLSAIPIFFILFIISTTSNDIDEWVSKETIKAFLLKHLAIIAWIMILWGIQVLGTHLQINNISPEQITLSIIALNTFLWLLSYIINFKDWIKIFHYWYYCGFIILIFRLIVTDNINIIREVTLLFIPLTLWIYTFINYILSNFSNLVWDKIKSLNFLYFNLWIIALIQNWLSNNVYFGTFFSQLYLTLLFASIFSITKYTNENPLETNIELSSKTVDQILTWKKPEKTKTKIWLHILLHLKSFFNTKSYITSFMLSLMNIVLIFLQIFLFFKHIWTSSNIILYEIIYWLSILTFFGNYIILKKIELYYNLQRIFAFFILNLWIYLSIVNIFWEVPLYMAIWWIIWNLITSLIIFWSKNIKDRNIIFKEDLFLWLIANSISTFINAFFILKLDLEYIIKFWLIILYIWIQLFIKYYNIKYINKNFS